MESRTEIIKDLIDKSIKSWNSIPKVKNWLSITEKSWEDKKQEVFKCELTIYTQDVIYQNSSQGIVNIKDRLFVIEWNGKLLGQTIERAYNQLLENVLLHGFSNGIRGLEYLKDFKKGF